MYFYSMFHPCSTVIQKINEAGKKKQPFLFGIDFELNDGFFIENPLQQQNVLFEIEGIGNIFQNKKSQYEKTPCEFSISIEPFDKYSGRFNTVREAILHGNSFLTNLTVKTPLKISLGLEEIFFRSKAKFKLYVPDKFVCFSPERFVEISNGHICSHPMKGTIDASIENAEKHILENEKEKSEHYTIVDLIRNDISSVADEVNVKRFRYIDRLQTNRGDILQVSSEIEGKLPDDYLSHLGDIILKMLPAGSVSGAPKNATLQIIRNAESEKRGFYTGVFGYFDSERLDSAVLIRYIEKENDNFYFRSGGGITAKSICEDEYAEVKQKIYLPN